MFEKYKNNKIIQIGAITFVVITASLLLGFLLFNFSKILAVLKQVIKILSPFFLGLVFAYCLNPLVIFFKNRLVKRVFKKKSNKFINNISLLITFLTFIALLILLVIIVIPQFLLSIEKLAVYLPNYMEQIKETMIDKLSSVEIKNLVMNNYDKIYKILNDSLNTSIIPQIDNWLVLLSSGLVGALKTILNIVLGFVIAAYFLLDKDNFIFGTKKIIYAIFSEKTAKRIMKNGKEVNEIFNSFFIGKLLDSLIIGIITFLFLIIFKFPYPLLIGVIVGITNIIPYFGPWFGGIPSALLILVVNPTKGLIFIVFIIILQQIDGNILGPKLCGSKIGIKSFWVFSAILIFGSIFGVIGMLIGVPIFTIIYRYLNNLIDERLKSKKLPTKNEEYKNIEKRI